MSEFVKEKVENGIHTICLDRVSKKNAITLDMYQGLTNALKAAEASANIRVSIVVGMGDDFTAGNDISEFVQIAQSPESMSPTMEFLQTLAAHPKPLMAAVEGKAVGVGATMLLHCDMVIAAENASLQLPFVKLGLVPEAASSFLLPSLAGHQRAFEKLVLGEPFSAQEAKDMGIINRLVEAGETFKVATEFASKIASLPPEAVALSKNLLKNRFQDEVQMTLMREGRIFKDRLQSTEARQAFINFLNKGKK